MSIENNGNNIIVIFGVNARDIARNVMHPVERLGVNSAEHRLAVYKNPIEALGLASMGRKLRAGQMLYGCEVGGAIVPSEEGDFLIELEREVLLSAEVDDLQSSFADGINILLRGLAEASPFLVPDSPRTWDERLNSVTSLAGCQF